MNNSIKEVIGVTAVTMELTRNTLLKGEIPTNDKTVSWDGEIQVYNEKNHNKSSLYGRVPVQVKAHEVEYLSGDKIKHRLNKNDLRNYYHDGGVLFFVVEFIDAFHKKVYYDALLPIDLKMIIEEMKDQASINHEFGTLPSENNALDIICRNFILNSRKQTQNVLSINASDINKNRTLVIPSVGPNLSTFFNYPTYLYSKEEHYNLEIPMERIQVLEIVQETNLQIGINGEIYYPNATKRMEKDKTIILFGGDFTIFVQSEADSDLSNLKLNLDRTGPLKERIKDTNFMIAVLTAEHIEVMGHQIPIETSDQGLMKELRDLVKDLEELDGVFDELNVTFNQSFDSLKEKDFRNMETLKDIILHQDYSDITTDLKQSSFLKLKIGSFTILLATTKKNDEWLVVNAFESDKIFRILASEDKSGPGFEISSYMIVEVKQLFKMANFNLGELEKSFLEIDYDTDPARQYVNYYLLDIVKYYDEVDQNLEFLDFTKKVYEHLTKFEEDNDETYFLNIMQIIRRQRSFNGEEIEKIIDRKNKATDPFVICGYLAILGNITEFDYYFNQLSNEDKDNFKKFPIYKFIVDALNYK
ncbi:hypothetical protein JSQ81_05680 [Sporosarcina sp. Marseille-Q4063]|uniref:hypothetical protein n=1 Tax=Sporosarcina sp. Marseille-Q4063 TaxID=2810514 RepID=UPI001BAF8CA9|nr:hypothetical protein [Sporosarcina sp. Marseille-Q4063]QUW23060.1 hypothetical protein JSQ81_05680 [Sporosarcina sp. Marseille-Q4063]